MSEFEIPILSYSREIPIFCFHTNSVLKKFFPSIFNSKYATILRFSIYQFLNARDPCIAPETSEKNNFLSYWFFSLTKIMCSSDFFILQKEKSHSTSIHPKKKKNVTLMSWILFIFIPYAHFSMNNKTLKFCEVILNRFQDIVFLNIF